MSTSDIARLTVENERLRRRVAALERELKRWRPVPRFRNRLKKRRRL